MIIFVLYDGIKNSVFDGQVLKPLENKVNNSQINGNHTKKAIIISFEKENISQEYKNQKLKDKKKIELIILKRGPFIGKFKLIQDIFKLKKILKNYKNYNLIARGPLAGLICAKAANFSDLNSFTIQARGLVAQEYKYSGEKEKPIKKLLNILRYYQFNNLEKNIYKQAHNLPKTKIEAVSFTLKEYLIKSFGAKSEIIYIAQDDIPMKSDKNLIFKWRTEIRNNLNITHDSIVYCYNGSIKAWQCPQEVITFFKSCLENKSINKNIFLLILTQDTQEFENLIKKANIPTDLYLITTVAHQEIYKYLAACDYGIIFREESIVNWVSRPTKILEYESVGLKIIHNNTVGFLENR